MPTSERTVRGREGTSAGKTKSVARDQVEDPTPQLSERSMPPSAQRRVRNQPQILSQTLVTVGEQVARLEREATQILALLAAQGFVASSVERHRRELERLRELLDRARARLLKARRAALEADSARDEVPESALARVHAELDRLEACDTEWARALAAIELAAQAGGGTRPRRLVVRGSERKRAMDYAERANPTTIVSDLSKSALRMVEEPHDKNQPESNRLGRSLDGQQILERMILPPNES